MNSEEFPESQPLFPWNPKRNSHAVDELVVSEGATLPLFVVKMKPRGEFDFFFFGFFPIFQCALSNSGKMLTTELIYQSGKSSFVRDERITLKSLIGLVQHHLKTSSPLELFCWDSGTKSFTPATEEKLKAEDTLLKAKQVSNYFAITWNLTSSLFNFQALTKVQFQRLSLVGVEDFLKSREVTLSSPAQELLFRKPNGISGANITRLVLEKEGLPPRDIETILSVIPPK